MSATTTCCIENCELNGVRSLQELGVVYNGQDGHLSFCDLHFISSTELYFQYKGMESDVMFLCNDACIYFLSKNVSQGTIGEWISILKRILSLRVQFQHALKLSISATGHTRFIDRLQTRLEELQDVYEGPWTQVGVSKRERFFRNIKYSH